MGDVASRIVEARTPTPEVYTPPQVKVVIMASSFGHNFVREVEDAGDYNYLVTADEGQPAHVTKPLIELADEPVMNFWLKALKQCPRVADLKRCVFMVSNAENHDELVGWARGTKAGALGGFPAQNIWCTGEYGAGSRSGAARDLAAFLRAQPAVDESHLLVFEADYCFEPHFNLQRILEHSMVRSKCCVSIMRLRAGDDLTHESIVKVDDDALPNPKVTSIDAAPSSRSATGREGVLAPLYFFKRQEVPALLAQCDAAPAWKAFGNVFAGLVAAGVPVYAHRVEFCFNVRTLKGCLFADAFFEEYLRSLAEEAAMKAAQKDTHSHLTLSEEDDKSLKQTFIVDDVRAHLSGLVQMKGELGGERSAEDKRLRDLLNDFSGRYELMLTTRRVGEHEDGLPVRFTNAGTWKRCMQRQHACYQTTNNDYGLKQPSQHEMPLVWNGTKGQFTNSFTGPPQGASLNAFPTVSRVHRQYDQINVKPHGAVSTRDKAHSDLKVTQIL